MNSQDSRQQFIDALRDQFEPRWPLYAREWSAIKQHFTAEVQADWTDFMVGALKPMTFNLWARGVVFQAFGDNLSSSPNTDDK